MDDLSSNLAGFKEKTKRMFDKTGIEKSGNVTAKKQKQSVNKVRNSQTFKDIKTEYVNKQSAESVISITCCNDEEKDLLVANCCLGILVHNKEWMLKNKAVKTTTRPTFGLSKKDGIKKDVEFCTQIEMHKFEESLKTAGPLLELSVGSNDLKLGTSHQKNSSSTKLKEVTMENVFIAIAAYSFVPVITLELFESDLRLTPLALEEIRKIENLISNMGGKNKSIIDSCCKFIETFGSHVSIGSIDVGGICKTSTTYDSKTQMTIEKCQDIARRAHTGYIKFMETATAEASYHVENEKNKSTNKITEESKLVHSCTQLSYPLKDCKHAEWSNNLIKHPGAWRVIKRGSPTGIWNILLNHSDDIQGCYRIAAMLRNAWQNKWNQNPDEVLDQVVTCAISSISGFPNNIKFKSFSRKNVVEVIEKLTLIASLNKRFKEYWLVGKFVSFFQNAVSQSNKLHLKHKVCLKILLGLLSDLTLNEHEYIVKWFTSPLFSCKENIFEAIIYFMNNAIKPVYTDIAYENAEKHWKSQVNEQITTEIAIIISNMGIISMITNNVSLLPDVLLNLDSTSKKCKGHIFIMFIATNLLKTFSSPLPKKQ